MTPRPPSTPTITRPCHRCGVATTLTRDGRGCCTWCAAHLAAPTPLAPPAGRSSDAEVHAADRARLAAAVAQAERTGDPLPWEGSAFGRGLVAALGPPMGLPEPVPAAPTPPSAACPRCGTEIPPDQGGADSPLCDSCWATYGRVHGDESDQAAYWRAYWAGRQGWGLTGRSPSARLGYDRGRLNARGLRQGA